MLRMLRTLRVSRYFKVMEEIQNLYPGIVEVEYFDSSLISVERPDLASIAGDSIIIPENRFKIELLEPGTCEVQSKDGTESLSLKFCAQLKIYPRFRPAFIFRDANDRTFLVASKSKPFPKMSMMRTFGSLPDKRPEVSYEITHVAIHTPVEIFL